MKKDARNYLEESWQKRAEKRIGKFPEFVIPYYKQIRTLNPSYCYTVLSQLESFLNFINSDLKSITIDDMTSNNVSDYLYNRKKTVSKNYWDALRGTLYRFFDFLVKEGKIEKNPVKDIKKNKNITVERKDALTEEQLIKIKEAVKKGVGNDKYLEMWKLRDELIIALFNITGARESGIICININDINFDKGELRIRDKGDKINYYNIKSIIPLVNKWLEKRGKIVEEWEKEGLYLLEKDSDALLLSRRRTRLSREGISKIVRKITKEALGEEYSPHKLRYAYGTILYQKTGDIYLVQQALKHTNVATTQIYIRNSSMINQIGDIAATALDY